MRNLINWIKEHFRELFWYGFFGVITTIVNIVVFYLLDTVCGLHYMIANVAAWIVANVIVIICNYVLSKLWVFKKRSS